jgi:pimeloyl-ACP methyl ester carboxylesterase
VSSARTKRPWLKILSALALGLALIWILWSERRPEHEGWLRSEAQARLQTWFPETLQPLPSEIGFDGATAAEPEQFLVVMIHGLDEPGGIFDELGPALEEAGHGQTRFLYPNDQSIAASADLLNRHWTELSPDSPIVLLGHSMGGLVIRDFVTRLYPAIDPDAARVAAALLIGTPNQGSEWARLRVWLEVRDLLGSEGVDDFGLFAGLRDGTGAAKVDLRPGSRFLRELNARSWPGEIPLRILGGEIRLEDEERQAALEAIQARTGDQDWSEAFARWLEESAAQLGDGVVAVEALPAPGATAPTIVAASHRGLLRPDPLNGGAPPGIAWTLEQLDMLGRRDRPQIPE